MNSIFYNLLLKKYKDSSLEIKKKSRVVLNILLGLIVAAIIMIIAEVIIKRPFSNMIPFMIGITLAIPSILFLTSGKYKVSVIFFQISAMVVLISLPIFDVYNHIFELYRFSFILMFFFVIINLISTSILHIALQITLGVASIIFLFTYKNFSLSDSLNYITAISCILIYTFSGFFFSLFFYLTKSIIKVAEDNELLAKQQRDSYKRFVPEEFLKALNKSSIMEVNLSDTSKKRMTIMFSDIRNFTTISESLSPEDNFMLLNSYLNEVVPIIHKHNGFVDKYVGDAIIALFNEASAAVDAVVEMQRKLINFNNSLKEERGIEFATGFALHTGDVMMGTIGNEERMDVTVISDAVNLSSRLQELTKLYKAPLLITESTLYYLNDPLKYDYRFVDLVYVKGRNSHVTIFEVFNGLPVADFNLRMQTKDLFERGIFYYLKKDIKKAFFIFKKIYHSDSSDKVAEIYLRRCLYMLKYGIPKDWDGIKLLLSKV